MKLIYFGTKNHPVADFIEKLGNKERAQVLACLKNIQELGFDCPRVQFRQIEGKLWEIKIKTNTAGYRIFYITIKKDVLVLLHAYKKQSQKTPKKEIDLAGKRLLEVLNNESFYFA